MAHVLDAVDVTVLITYPPVWFTDRNVELLPSCYSVETNIVIIKFSVNNCFGVISVKLDAVFCPKTLL